MKYFIYCSLLQLYKYISFQTPTTNLSFKTGGLCHCLRYYFYTNLKLLGLALFWNKNLKGLRVMGLGFFLGVLLGKMENKEKEDNETASIFADAVGLAIGNLFPIMLIILCHSFLMIPFHSSQPPACWAVPDQRRFRALAQDCMETGLGEC